MHSQLRHVENVSRARYIVTNHAISTGPQNDARKMYSPFLANGRQPELFKIYPAFRDTSFSTIYHLFSSTNSDQGRI